MRKRSTKRLKYTGNLSKTNVHLKVSVNSRLKKHLDHWSRESIESSCASKKTVDIDVLVTSGNGDKKSFNLSDNK